MPQVHTTNLKSQADVNRVGARSPLATAIRHFLLDREARRCTPATLVWYGRYLAALADWLTQQGVCDPGAVTPHHLRSFLVDLRARKLADRTIHHHASAARAFFNFCVAEELLAVSPMAKVKLPRLPKEIQPAFTPADVSRLFDACETERNRAIVLCLLDTGCRLAEFLGLNVGDVDLAAGTVTVRHGKGKKDRLTYIGQQARKHLRRYLNDRPHTQPTNALWVVTNGDHRLSRIGMQRLLQRIGERAGVPHCHAHTFRRTCALMCLRRGMDLHRLAVLLGHADIGVLKRYLPFVEQDLHDAHERYGPVDGLLRGKR